MYCTNIVVCLPCIQVYDDIYLNYGGADALHLKLLGSGIPVSVEFMRIPFSQLNPIHVSFLPFKLFFSASIDLLKFIPAKAIILRYFKFVTETFEEILGRLFFPILERFPKLVCIQMISTSSLAMNRERCSHFMEDCHLFCFSSESG